MATHDYVIDNSTGANVRADLNLVLQAILTNNSSGSAPSTTAAYMWWADTTNGVLKIRNSANNAWVELLQLDGTLTLEDGSASTPALAFRDDLNTGIFSSAADKFNVATGGVERMELGATTIFNEDGADVDFRIEGDTDTNLFYADAGNNRIGLGIASPTSKLYVNTVSTEHVITAATADSNGNSIINILSAGTTGNSRILFSDTAANDGIISYSHNDRALVFGTAGTSEDMRIDSSGRLLVGSSSNRAIANHSPGLQLQGTGFSGATFSIINNANAGNGAFLYFATQRSGSVGGSTVVQPNDSIGTIRFFGGDGSNINSYAAQIKASIDGTPGASDMPGRLTFSTTADGSSSPTERVRVDKDGAFMVGTTSGRTAEFLHPDGFAIRGDVKGQIQNTVTDNSCMLLNRDGTDGQVLGFRKDGSGIGEIGVSGGEIYFQFGSTGSASHRLDDYEEGTFTPLLSDNISSGTANSYQNQSGHYTKIGNIVHIIGAIRADDISNLSSSENLKVRGLPFVVSDVTSGSGEPDMLHIPFMNNLSSNSSRGFVYGRMENGVAAANIGKFNNSNQNGADLLFSEINSGSATFFSFSATYRTGS